MQRGEPTGPKRHLLQQDQRLSSPAFPKRQRKARTRLALCAEISALFWGEFHHSILVVGITERGENLAADPSAWLGLCMAQKDQS